MSSKIYSIILILILTSGLCFSQNGRAKFSTGLQVGYNKGFGFQLNFLVSDFAEGFPFSAKLGAGFTMLDPGNAPDARRIFINDATNGTPEESGRFYDLRLDFLYKIKLLGMKKAFVSLGPRFTMFNGNFNFVGGNEDFDITTNQWGIGAGFETYFPISSSIDLLFNFGYDYFFSSALKGHDTSYSPDGENVNPRRDYDYKTADKAINQPKHNPRAMIGFSYSL